MPVLASIVSKVIAEMVLPEKTLCKSLYKIKSCGQVRFSSFEVFFVCNLDFFYIYTAHIASPEI
jgi:hypothetical protein